MLLIFCGILLLCLDARSTGHDVNHSGKETQVRREQLSSLNWSQHRQFGKQDPELDVDKQLRCCPDRMGIRHKAVLSHVPQEKEHLIKNFKWSESSSNVPIKMLQVYVWLKRKKAYTRHLRSNGTFIGNVLD